jgi:enamine deaminase RidA (YjgF/YER057c/UK114 family)
LKEAKIMSGFKMEHKNPEGLFVSKAFQEVAGLLDNPPLVTVLFVSGVGHPGCLLEIDGIAVIEDKD